MLVEGTIKVSGRVYSFTCQEENKEWMAKSMKDDIFQELHEENLDKCRGHEWSTEQSYKIKAKLDKAKVKWKQIK